MIKFQRANIVSEKKLSSLLMATSNMNWPALRKDGGIAGLWREISARLIGHMKRTLQPF